MRNIIRFFAERHLLANILTLSILVLGFATLSNIRRDTFPEAEMGEVIVTSKYPGASAEDVELKVTNKIEAQLKDVPGIRRYTSASMENASVIRIFTDPDLMDQDEIVQKIRDAVDRVTDYPPEMKESPAINNINPGKMPMLEIGIAGEAPYRVLRDYARSIEKKLKNVDGVGLINRFGWRAREIHVDVDPNKIEEYRISLGEIISAIGTRNIRASGGSFESYTSEKNIVTISQFKNPMDVGRVIVRSTFDGPTVTINDLATISDTFENTPIESRTKGHRSISLTMTKQSDADVVRTVDRIKEVLEQEKQYLPKGVKILYGYDGSRFVRGRFNIVLSNGMVGLLFVIILLSIFLHHQIAVWVALGIPVAVLGSITLLPVFGHFLDSIALSALILVIGIIVDDAIIIAENIYSHWEKGASPIDAAVNGTHEVLAPVFTTALTTFVAFMPMFFMPGMMGRFCFVIPLTISCALLISLIESTVALPSHLQPALSSLHKNSRRRRENKPSWFLALYQVIISISLKVRYLTVMLFVGALLAVGYYAKNHMEIVLFPADAADEVIIRIEMPVGSSVEATSDKIKEIETLLEDLPPYELSSYVTRVGTYAPQPYMLYYGEQHGFIIATLTPSAERDRNANEIVKALKAKAAKVSGYKNIYFQVNTGGPPVGRPITIHIIGGKSDHRLKLGEEIKAYLQSLPGARDISSDQQESKEQIEIDIDYEAAARLGLTVADIARTVRIAYDGVNVSDTRLNDEDVQYRVQLSEVARKDIQHLKELRVPNNLGKLISLKQVADFHVGPGTAVLNHYDGDRTITLEGDVDQSISTPTEIMDQVMLKFERDRRYPNVRVIAGGEGKETEKAIGDLATTFIVALIGLYFILVVLFNSLTQPALVMFAIPFAVVGVVATFAAHSEPLGFLAMLGSIGLAGVVVNDSLVMVDRINRLRNSETSKKLSQIVAEGSASRVRPVLVTSITTVVGLLPLAYGLGGSDPYMSPMALALGYGLVFSTPIILLLLPCLYMINEDFAAMGRWIKAKLT
jgi:multidrug efflux pump subunit AcrB